MLVVGDVKFDSLVSFIRQLESLAFFESRKPLAPWFFLLKTKSCWGCQECSLSPICRGEYGDGCFPSSLRSPDFLEIATVGGKFAAAKVSKHEEIGSTATTPVLGNHLYIYIYQSQRKQITQSESKLLISQTVEGFWDALQHFKQSIPSQKN